MPYFFTPHVFTRLWGLGQEPFFKHKPSSSEISPPSPPQVNLKSSNAFQILQSDVSEVVAPIEFADQFISPAISPRLTEVDTHGKTQFLPSPASSHTDCMQASLGASCPSTTYACKCPLPSFTSQTELISSHCNKLEFFQYFFIYESLKNVNKNLKLLQLYTSVE